MLKDPPDSASSISKTLTACKEVLANHYGDRLVAITLYGSAARDALKPASDIDLLILLQSPLNYFQELW